MCENGATAEFSEELWGLVNISPNNNVKIKCSIDFKNGTNLIEYLRNLNSSELVEDDFGNLRYIGKDPNNYVSFNGELWRIIGVMKDIENPDGTKDDKVKLIRSESIGKFYWDKKQIGVGSSTANWGSNKWNDSQLMMMLNPRDRIPANYTIDNDGYVLDQKGYKIYRNSGSYWDRTTGYRPEQATTNSFTESSVSFNSIGLTAEAKEMISSSMWTINVNINSILDFQNTLTKEFYSYEAIKKEWIGEVGLMYPSDYGYATNGGETTNREECLNYELSSWYEKEDCYSNDWLYKPLTHQFTMIRMGSNNILEIFKDVYYREPNNEYYVKPVIYLKSNILITGEINGSSTSPFTLKAE